MTKILCLGLNLSRMLLAALCFCQCLIWAAMALATMSLSHKYLWSEVFFYRTETASFVPLCNFRYTNYYAHISRHPYIRFSREPHKFSTSFNTSNIFHYARLVSNECWKVKQPSKYLKQSHRTWMLWANPRGSHNSSRCKMLEQEPGYGEIVAWISRMLVQDIRIVASTEILTVSGTLSGSPTWAGIGGGGLILH